MDLSNKDVKELKVFELQVKYMTAYGCVDTTVCIIAKTIEDACMVAPICIDGFTMIKSIKEVNTAYYLPQPEISEPSVVEES